MDMKGSLALSDRKKIKYSRRSRASRPPRVRLSHPPLPPFPQCIPALGKPHGGKTIFCPTCISAFLSVLLPTLQAPSPPHHPLDRPSSRL